MMHNFKAQALPATELVVLQTFDELVNPGQAAELLFRTNSKAEGIKA